MLFTDEERRELLSGISRVETVQPVDTTKIKSVKTKFSEVKIPETFKSTLVQLYKEKQEKEDLRAECWEKAKLLDSRIKELDNIISALKHVVEIEFETKEKNVTYKEELVHHKALIQ